MFALGIYDVANKIDLFNYYQNETISLKRHEFDRKSRHL